MRIYPKDIPEEVIEEYDVIQFANEYGYVYYEIKGEIYGVVQAGQIENLDLVKHLKTHCNFPLKQIPSLWFHKTKSIIFTLVVDDFIIKYIKKEHIDHLFKAVEEQ